MEKLEANVISRSSIIRQATVYQAATTKYTVLNL